MMARLKSAIQASRYARDHRECGTTASGTRCVATRDMRSVDLLLATGGVFRIVVIG